MNNAIRAINTIHAERAFRFQAEAERERFAAAIHETRHIAWTRRIRRIVGRTIVRAGARLAADPALPAAERHLTTGVTRP